MKITIYTDGSSRGNPGPGGWASIIVTDTEVVELGGGEKETTNNRMELMGAIEGLKHTGANISDNKGGISSVEVCTDSEYVKKGITEWISGWIQRGWKTAAKKPVLNQDLWQALYKESERLTEGGVHVTWTYVPGHAGVPLNERADTIATSCADEIIAKNASNLQLYRGEKESYPYF